MLKSLNMECFLLYLQVDECADCRPAEKKNILQTIVCPQCHHRRIERKEIIQEIVETEINYGRDLNLLKEVWRLFLFIPQQ